MNALDAHQLSGHIELGWDSMFILISDLDEHAQGRGDVERS